MIWICESDDYCADDFLQHIVPAFADQVRKIITFGPPMVATGRYGEDLLKIAEWFRTMLPDYERFKVLEAQAMRLIEQGGE